MRFWRLFPSSIVLFGIWQHGKKGDCLLGPNVPFAKPSPFAKGCRGADASMWLPQVLRGVSPTVVFWLCSWCCWCPSRRQRNLPQKTLRGKVSEFDPKSCRIWDEISSNGLSPRNTVCSECLALPWNGFNSMNSFGQQFAYGVGVVFLGKSAEHLRKFAKCVYCFRKECGNSAENLWNFCGYFQTSVWQWPLPKQPP